MRVTQRLTLALALVLCQAPTLAGQSATLSPPVTGGERGEPFGGGAAAGLPADYVEEERFLSGTATSYVRAGAWGQDGRWDVEADETSPYAVRLLFRRPADPNDFNGVVVVEWLNVTAQAEGAADYMQMAEELLREGYAWVGVGAQAIGVHAPTTGLKAWDPERYAPLSHPGDRFSYDIFTQAAEAIRDSAEPGGPLTALEVEHVIATGRSQSAFRLVTYLNAFHPETRAFDGYFVHSRGASGAGLRSESLAPDEPEPVPAGAWIRTDLDVPVFDLQAEGDMTTLRSHLTRQPPHDLYRRWEIAGAAHTEIPLWVVEVPPPLSMGPGCAAPVNAAPHHAVVKAGLRALTRWVRDGIVPPQSPDIELTDPTAADPIRRDVLGNAIGGIRLPHVAAPTATIDGLPNAVATPVEGVQNFCRLFGRTVPFDDATLRRLYPTRGDFVDAHVAAVDALEREGYLLPPEAALAREAVR